MPNIDWNAYDNAAESTGNSRAQLLPGAYVAQVQAIRTEGETRYGTWTADEKQYVLVVYDIAEGDCAGEYSRDWFMKDGRLDPSKDWMHCFYLSWKNYGYFKMLLHRFSESNPGFDAEAAARADKWEMFVGKKIGVLLDGEVSTNDNGYDRWRFSASALRVQDVKTGNYRKPKITDNRTKVEPVADVYDDIPFM